MARAQKGVEQAERQGADEAEVLLWDERKVQATKAGSLGSLEEAHVPGTAARLLVEGRLAHGVSTGTRPEDIQHAIQAALQAVQRAPRTAPFDRFPSPLGTLPGPTTIHPALAEPSHDRLVAVTDTLAAAAESSSDVRFYTAEVASYRSCFALANTSGLSTWDRHARESASIEARCGPQGGTQKSAKRITHGIEPTDVSADLEAMSEAAVDLARGATKARTLDRPVDQVILEPAAATQLLHQVASSFAGRAADQKRSRFAGRIGQAVAAEELTLRDLPRGRPGCRHQRVDDEGVPTTNRSLVEDGILQGYVYDWTSAQELGREPTGNGLRGLSDRYRSQPGSRVANLCVDPGTWSLEEMVEAADRAVLVRGGMLGSFVMDRVRGDFSTVSTLAYYVEGGRIQEPLTSTTVAGNLFEGLLNIKAVGREPVTFPKGTSTALWVEGITCAT